MFVFKVTGSEDSDKSYYDSSLCCFLLMLSVILHIILISH